MPGLRWILLLLGLVFIAALAWRELRRQRQAGGNPIAARSRVEPSFDSNVTPALPVAAALPGRDREIHRPVPVVEWDRPVEDTQLEESAVAGELAGKIAEYDPEAQPDPEVPVTLAFSDGPGPAPLVDWPPEGQRRICNIRIVPQRPERFSGRSVRQSLLACGLQHGEFGIFHLPGPGQRVVMSAANLARPGLLDPLNMDYQRFPGLNLFAVMPGPLPASDTLDRLFLVADELAERIDGRVQDEAGAPLDGARRDALRARFQDESPAAAASGP